MSLLLPVAVLLAAASQDRAVGAFHSISVSGGLRVALTKASTPSLKLSGDAEDLARVETFVKNGQLVIRQRGVGFHTPAVDAEIGFTALDAFEASGGVIARGEGVA